MPRRRRKRRWTAIYVLLGIVALVAGVAYIVQANNPCNVFPYGSIANRGLVEHYHALLEIYVNGTQLNLPANIGDGDSGACIQPLHVHANAPNTNVIHIESANSDNYTLGDFFRVWAATPGIGGPRPIIFNQNQLFNNTAVNGYVVRMFVNGSQSSAYENLILSSHMTIVIGYGRSTDSTPWANYRSLSAQPWPYGNL